MAKHLKRCFALIKNKMEKVFVTLKGSQLKSNHWKVGQEISCHPNIAAMFISKGIASATKDEEEIVVPVKKEKKK